MMDSLTSISAETRNVSFPIELIMIRSSESVDGLNLNEGGASVPSISSMTVVGNLPLGSMNNGSGDLELPLEMQFNDGHLLSIVLYSILMIFSAIGNLSVLTTIIKIRVKGRLNRVNLLLLHLAIADLFVTFLMMPLEIGWNATVSWRAGDVICRVMSFFRTFGIFLSGFLIICISLDRYFAVLKPMALPEANRRSRLMLYFAWIASVICSLPQSYVFHVEKHPVFPWYEQCITLNSFPTKSSELTYNFFGFFFMYAIPMLTILFCYTAILYEIFKVNALKKNGESELGGSSMEALSRAKVRTLKMTVVIVATFFLCWTPYNVMSLWYWIDKESARSVDHRIQKGLFLFACTNSCANPLIYGLFHMRKSTSNSNKQVLANNMRLQRLGRPPYGVRVRWRPRDCVCTAGGTSSGDGAKTTPAGTFNLDGFNGKGGANGFHRTRTTDPEGFYASQRRSRSSALIPLTSREFQRHVPPVPCAAHASISAPVRPFSTRPTTDIIESKLRSSISRQSNGNSSDGHPL